MAFLEIHTSTAISIIILTVGLLVGGFLLLFGIANLINPDVPDGYLTQNTKVCLVVRSIGVVFLLLSIAAFRGILIKRKSAAREDKT
ncbi:MAG: hypothetical protein A2Y71_12020 [Bacteroidetes bacterium RBG_13_42_15]|nr:MAG: hypothetical protein A2Y71_12020 [Bacteroidetes bacterium RBG_13_42_15]